MKKRILSLLMVGAMTAGMLAGCGSKTDAPADNTAKEETPATEEAKEETPATEEKEAVEPVTLNVAYMPNYGSLWSVENAIAQGYLEEEGITVNLVEFQDGPTIISAMESGSIDVGYIGQGAHKLCINGQATIFALSHISNGDALIGGEGITSIEDLKGKQVAYSSGTSSEDILVNSLTSVGLTMDANATKLADNMTFSDKTVSLASWICMPKYAEENRDVLVRFTRALFKAMDYAAADHQEDTAALIAKQIAGDQDTVYDQRGDAEWLTGKEVSEGAADGTVEGYYELQKENFIEAGAVEVDPPVSDYVLLDVMKEAGEY